MASLVSSLVTLMSTSPARFTSARYFFEVRSFRSVSNSFENDAVRSNAMHRCVLRYFGLLFRCELSVASSLRRRLRSGAPNCFVCFSYHGGCEFFLKWSFGSLHVDKEPSRSQFSCWLVVDLLAPPPVHAPFQQ